MSQLTDAVSKYVKELFTSHPPLFSYHNLQHTEDVVKIIEDIAANSEINDDEKELLVIAAWFHDTGYPENILNHEMKSAEIAQAYLNKIYFPAGKIEIIKQLILSTRIPQNPATKLEEIICDADIAYIGKNDLLSRISLLRNEWEMTLNRKFGDFDWLKKNIDFIEANPFRTQYAKKLFSEARKNNLALLRQMAEKAKDRKPD